MKKQTYAFLALCALGTSLCFGQGPIATHSAATAPAPSLHKLFDRYWTFDLSASALKNQLWSNAESPFALDLPSLGKIEFSLYENGLISGGFEAVLGTDQGTIRSQMPDVKTFYGQAADGPANGVALTVADGFLYGSFKTATAEYFIEPLSFLSADRTKDRYVVYDVSTVRSDAGLACGVQEVAKKEAETLHYAAEGQRTGICYHVELAIASDFAMYSRYSNNSATVMAHNVGVWNNVAANYDDEFADYIYFIIATQYVSTSAATSLETALTSSTDVDVLLNNFKTWGNSGGFGATTYDLAQCWMTRDLTSSTCPAPCGIVGYASVGAVCGTSRYQIDEDFTGSNPSGSGYQLRVMVAHETGHNFNLTHDDAIPGPYLPYIMSALVNNTSSWSPAGVGAQSIPTLNAYLGTIGCLAGCSANFGAASYSTIESSVSGSLPAGSPTCGMGYVDFTVPVIYSGDPSVGGTFDVLVSGGSATNGDDFDLLTPTVTFGTGSVTRTANATIRIYDDMISEANETIVLSLGGSSGNLLSTTITIVNTDKDPATYFASYGSFGTSASLITSYFLRGSQADHRVQYVVSAAELTAGGFAANDPIDAIAFNVYQKNSTQPYNGFTISAKHTASAPSPQSYEETGFTTLHTSSFTPVVGWNKLNFSSPFVWNGTDNIRFNVCYDNASSTADDNVYATSGSGYLSFVSSASGSGCSISYSGGYSYASVASTLGCTGAATSPLSSTTKALRSKKMDKPLISSRLTANSSLPFNKQAALISTASKPKSTAKALAAPRPHTSRRAIT